MPPKGTRPTSERVREALFSSLEAMMDLEGAKVLDLYAGLGTVAEACALEGRRYVGAEVDPDRHARALGLVAVGGRT